MKTIDKINIQLKMFTWNYLTFYDHEYKMISHVSEKKT